MIFSDEGLAAITIKQEAEDQGYNGMIAVGEVIRTRMKTRYQSNGTVAGTVLRPWQFSGWNQQEAGRLRTILLSFILKPDDPINRQCVDAWHESIGTNLTKGANLYFAPKVLRAEGVPDPAWVKHPRVVFVEKINDHYFYREV